MASWFRNLFEQRSFVASGKARQLHRAFGALYSPLAVTSKKTGYLTPIRSPSTSVALSRSYTGGETVLPSVGRPALC